MIKRLKEWEVRWPLLVEEEVAIVVVNVAVEQEKAEKCDNKNSDNESVQHQEVKIIRHSLYF